jgi:PAS domain S-box-containing protein
VTRPFFSPSILLFLLFFLNSSLCFAASAGSPSRTIRVAMDDNYPPYVFLDNDGMPQGILVDQWRLWQKKTGIRVEIQAMNWSSAINGMKAGAFDAIDTIFKTRDRSGWLDFSTPYARIEVPAFFRNDIKGISDIQSLDGFVVAVKEGDAAIGFLRRHGIENLMLFKGYESIIRAAKEHKVNVFVIDKPPAIYFLYKYGIYRHYNASPPLAVGEFHRAVNKGNTALLQEIEAGFAQLSAAELKQIDKKWQGSPIISSESTKYFLVGTGVLCLLVLGLFFWNSSLRRAVRKRTYELEMSEKALRKSESRYRSIIENTQDTFYRTDTQGILTLTSPSGATLLGYASPQEMIGRPMGTFWMHPDKREAMLDLLKRDGVIRDYEVVLVRKDGSHVLISTTSSYYYDTEGRILGVEGILRDITERKQAEKALRTSEERMRLFFERQLVGMAITSPEKGWLQVNDRLAQMLGYSSEELFQRTWAELTHPEDVAADVAQFNRILAGEIDEYSLEKRFIRKDGDVLYTNLSVGCVRRSDSTVDFILALLADITDHKRAEEALLSERQYLIDIIDFLPDATLVIDTEGRIVAWNRAAEAMTGIARTELLGRGDYAYAIPFCGERRPILIDFLNIPELEGKDLYSDIKRSGETIYAETFVQTLNKGQGAYIWCAAAPLYNGSGTRTGAIEVIRNVSELKQAEQEKIHLQEQLMQAQKMESIGRLAGGVAHDFNNMLGVILGYAELALNQLNRSHPLFTCLEEIGKAGRRSADITQQLLAFARKQTVSPRVLDLNATVEGMLNMLRRLIGEDVQLNWQPASSLWPVCMDPSQIDQILANLCLNARAAITDVGIITIETANSTIDDADCADHPDVVPGEYVRLTVRDTGRGMDEETLHHIFEPFFTTKNIGEGTGLGLATVYGAVKQNNGFIQVVSAPEQGTIFTLYLPRFDGTTGEQETTETSEEAMLAQDHTTVLLVEDEAAILEMLTRMLKILGYTVLRANSPEEALRLAGDHHGEIQLLMTDVVMPGMNGRDLAKNLLARSPNLKCLFMSGYTADVIAHHGVLDPGVCFLQKPFSVKQLTDKMQEALER